MLAFPCAWATTGSAIAGLVGLIAFVSLILIHELGHALVARAYGLRVFSIRAFWLHGLCTYQSSESQQANVAIAWGGVAAQATLLVFAFLLARVTVVAIGEIPAVLAPLFLVWIPINFFNIFSNLLPIPPLDGAMAWRILPMLWRKLAARKSNSLAPPAKTLPVTEELIATKNVVSIEAHRAKRDSQR